MIHVIGFGMNNAADEDGASLEAIAQASGGLYVCANSAAELRRALEVTTEPTSCEDAIASTERSRKSSGLELTTMSAQPLEVAPIIDL